MNFSEILFSSIGAFVATLIASFFSATILAADGVHVILASTGASAVLVFALPYSPASQPWNLIGGQMLSALVGVACYQLIPNSIIAASAATGLSMVFMGVFRCMHPPGGATAISAVVGGDAVHNLGYAFVIAPVLINAVILLSIAMAVGTLRTKNPFYDD
ncbi:MAG: HPP family protein [Pseudomonadota bacterium]|nr:HPP family protein [Pseudomonadota bacterium]